MESDSIELDVARRANRILSEKPVYVVEERPSQTTQTLDLLTLILLMPFLPLIVLLRFLQIQPRRRIAVTRIEKLPNGGYEIIEYEY